MEVIQSHHVHKVLEIVTLIYPEMINIWSLCQVPVGFFLNMGGKKCMCVCVCVQKPEGRVGEAFDIYQTTQTETGQH